MPADYVIIPTSVLQMIQFLRFSDLRFGNIKSLTTFLSFPYNCIFWKRNMILIQKDLRNNPSSVLIKLRSVFLHNLVLYYILPKHRCCAPSYPWPNDILCIYTIFFLDCQVWVQNNFDKLFPDTSLVATNCRKSLRNSSD